MCTTEAREGPAAAATRRPRFTPMAFRARRTRAAEAEAELAPQKRTAHLQPRVLTSAAAEGLASSSFDTTPDVSQTARRDARVTKKSFIKDPMTRPRVIGRRPCLTARLSIGVSEPRRRRGDRASSSPPGRHARASDLTRRGTFRAHLSNGVVSSWFSNHRRLTIRKYSMTPDASRGANERRTPAQSFRCRGQSEDRHRASQYHASPHRAQGTNEGEDPFAVVATRYASSSTTFVTFARRAPFPKTPFVALASRLRHSPSLLQR